MKEFLKDILHQWFWYVRNWHNKQRALLEREAPDITVNYPANPSPELWLSKPEDE